MFLNSYLPSYVGLILVLLMIFFGRAFRENWKTKNEGWIIKSWIYGFISSTSFFILAFVPLDL